MTEEITSPSQKVRFRTILKSSRHLLDMALVNVLIVHRYSNRVNGQKPTKHYAFFETLMEQLLAVDAAAFKDIEARRYDECHFYRRSYGGFTSARRVTKTGGPPPGPGPH
ncbi:hypothetical protein PC110_g14980 [Phytophthora cactorum]|uniref:Uncharacterized protein n=1 Tax=Phytophthora cactorum TaxID=29920 RepID=A0A329RVR6_9STRA|nr:hypothetical protein C6341_g181 [Phytophthora cactorum]RAW28645.1 hypothetical protein PC110_g14980 [Phytophthora cactorum]